MTTTSGIEFERQVAETIKKLDFRVTAEPQQETEGMTWQKRVSSWLTEPTHATPVPDLLVARGDRKILIEAKAYPVLLGPVIQAKHFADYYNCPVIICVPDEAFPRIPTSVRAWADANDIVLSPLGEICDKITALL